MLTAKSRYAVKVMMDLALNEGFALQHRKEIAKRHNIPEDYVDHIIIALRKGDLIKTIRGKGGGIKLNKGTEEISVWDILDAAENRMSPVHCLDHKGVCEIEENCISKGAWGIIDQSMQDAMSNVSLKYLVDDWKKNHSIGDAAKISDGTGCPTISKG